ncbi:DUF2271 domain-containing protein [Phaeovulum sp. W22_SRMD_FR3]|uniref:DUF2271 domain-containing protein n=1 Tax=Phaeovulum sp. W22_SRMD_FR3 TaxID=3240274 RepID=UPI003F945F3D
MKSLYAILALTTALTLPSLGAAREVTLTTQLRDYGGENAYLAYYLTDPQGAYVGSLWMAGGKARWYQHLTDWYRATGGDTAEISGITGASVGSGRSLTLTLDLADSLFDAGYQIHIDAGVEHFPESPSEVVVPLTTAGSGQVVPGRAYIQTFAYKL